MATNKLENVSKSTHINEIYEYLNRRDREVSKHILIISSNK